MTRELLSKEGQSVLGAFLYKFDIGQAYHHIDIDKNYQKHLDFDFGLLISRKILEKKKDRNLCITVWKVPK